MVQFRVELAHDSLENSLREGMIPVAEKHQRLDCQVPEEGSSTFCRGGFIKNYADALSWLNNGYRISGFSLRKDVKAIKCKRILDSDYL